MAQDLPISVGDTAPDFELPDQNGRAHKLSDYKGRWVVLYFYPKALTPGCTTQAQALRDNIKDFEELNASVIGVSADEQTKLHKFTEKHDLPFTLLGDTSHDMLEKYGMWQPKKMFGHEFLGVPRSTIVINPEGKVAHIVKKASPKTHHEDMLNWLKEHRDETAA